MRNAQRRREIPRPQRLEIVFSCLWMGLISLCWPAVGCGENDDWFFRLDADHDGVVQAGEVAKEDRRLFEQLLRDGDADGDGKLSAEEFARSVQEGEQRLLAQRPGPADPPGAAGAPSGLGPVGGAAGGSGHGSGGEMAEYDEKWHSQNLTLPWIVQTTEYLQNEMPLNFLKTVWSDSYEDVSSKETHVAYRLSGGSYRVFLRQLTDREHGYTIYGYTIYSFDKYGPPLQRGRMVYRQPQTRGRKARIWHPYGTEAGLFLGTVDLNRGENKFIGERDGVSYYGPPEPVAPMRGDRVDFDVIALNVGAKLFIDRGADETTRSWTGSEPPRSASPQKFLGDDQIRLPSPWDWGSFQINRGAPADRNSSKNSELVGRVRYLDWEKCDFSNH